MNHCAYPDIVVAREEENCSVSSTWLILAGLVWGFLTAFSLASESFGMMMGIGLILAIPFAMLHLGVAVGLAWFQTVAGLLLGAHVAVACVSGWLGKSEFDSIIRYIALIPAFSLCLSAARAGVAEAVALRKGLTLAGMTFVAFHLFHLEWGSLLDPAYRFEVFLGTNGTAFVSVMIALSALDLGCRDGQSRQSRLLWLVGCCLCAVIWISTKSRTASVAFAAGFSTFVLLRFQTRQVRWLSLGALVLVVLYFAHNPAFLIDLLSLDDKYRSIETGTGRFALWNFVVTEMFVQAPLLGVGPGNHYEIVQEAVRHSSAHNGLLMALAETGVFGVLPVLGLVFLCTWKLIRFRHNPAVAWAGALFVAGLTESMGEIMFFSIGNPGSLLFLVSASTLASGNFADTRAGDESLAGGEP